MNFKKETLDMLEKHNKTINDIEFITITKIDFSNSKGEIVYTSMCIENDIKDIFNKFDFEYDNGYGDSEIPDIKIVGKDWWLERYEYDGSEWWEFKTLPVKPSKLIRMEDMNWWRE